MAGIANTSETGVHDVIILTDKATGATIGTISKEQLEFLRGELVAETDEDQDYWINRDTLDLFREHGADAMLVAMIEQGMAGREDIEIVWAEG
jgi:hypothetical protein